MSVWWLASLFALGYVSSAQELESPARPGPADLVSFAVGSPVSVQQIEERVHNLPDGSSTVEIMTSNIYRDSIGRLRIESIPGGSGESHPVFLVDPTSGVKAVLSAKDKLAYRIKGPKAGENGFAYGVGGMGEGLPSGLWRTSTENLGRRTIDGIEVEGQRITQTSSNQPSLVAVYDRWYSRDLRVTALAEASGPSGRHTARIQNVRRGEPDPALFNVPADFKIVDLQRTPDGPG